ncbi:MAG: sugar phosphate nucleotidyltransferase [Candidatus Omnitrophica bacterium]|nr:sugar phosphate nucleotidyltransferase [Candidatus Omnitrophota bacterium]
MKTIILAAGYATRLYPLTLNTPKSLLTIGNKPIIDYILDNIEMTQQIEDVFVVTNHKFFTQFQRWLVAKQKVSNLCIKLINDGSTSLENKLGAIGDINLAISRENIDDDLLCRCRYFCARLVYWSHGRKRRAIRMG